jgi:diguanylate cyclase (GGDEF)-like protein
MEKAVLRERKRTVKLSKEDRRCETASALTAGALAEGALAESVGRLADCLNDRAAAHGDAMTPSCLATAYRAVSAALLAEQRIADLSARVAELETVAVTDPLTGLLNRRGMQLELERALAAARRYDEQGVLIYIDLDGFKPINDAYGHAAGDHVLRRVGAVLSENVRPTDRVARVGGDEFVVLLTRVAPEAGLTRAELLERRVNQTAVEWQDHTLAVRASFGFQAFGPNDAGPDVLGRADETMYAMKRLRADLAGRSRTL